MKQLGMDREAFGLNMVHLTITAQGHNEFTLIAKSLRDCDESFVTEFVCDRLTAPETIDSVEGVLGSVL